MRIRGIRQVKNGINSKYLNLSSPLIRKSPDTLLYLSQTPAGPHSEKNLISVFFCCFLKWKKAMAEQN